MSRHPIGWVVALVGLWRVIAAFALGYTAMGVALWNAVIVGVLLIGLGLWLAVTPDERRALALYWASTVAGAWVFIAPFVLGYTHLEGVVSNDVLTGGIVAALAGWFGLFISRRFGQPA